MKCDIMEDIDLKEVFDFLSKLSEYDSEQDRELETILGMKLVPHSDDYYAIHAVVLEQYDIEINLGRMRPSPIELDDGYHPWYGYLFVDGVGHASIQADSYKELSKKFIKACRKICNDIKNPKGWNQRVQ